MRPVLIVSGVLGTGTVLVFALAGLVATLFPSGSLVNASWNGGCVNCGGWMGGGAGPAISVPAPGVVIQGGAIRDDSAAFPNGTDGDLQAQP